MNLTRSLGLLSGLGAGCILLSSACSGGGSPAAPIVPDPTGANGGACLVADTCQSKVCTANKCAAATPADKIKNGKETDVDCGGGEGSTPPCATALACTGDFDCVTRTCIKNVCSEPSVTDGKRNGTETDVDCGGPNAGAARCKAGSKCAAKTDCASSVCLGKICQTGTSRDNTKNDDETGADCGGTRAPLCEAGAGCIVRSDCRSSICVAATKLCADIKPNDGAKNGSETDLDCGGPEAVACEAGKDCLVATDCDSLFCTATKCEPRKPGRKDGDETDIDCGGRLATTPRCVADNACLANADCSSNACSTRTKKCLEGPSCSNYLGGETCGAGHVGSPTAAHESCCRTLPVAGYTEPGSPGKRVFVDKYEITAGRMRTFLNAMAAANGGQPNVKAYIAANRPARWNDNWNVALPEGYASGAGSYTITTPTPANLRMVPGQDVYSSANFGIVGDWSINSGPQTINAGIYFALGAANLFPEYVTGPAWWGNARDYAVTHGYNCGNGLQSYGLGTYYFDDATVAQYSGGASKGYSQNELDVKSLNCTPSALFAAFCAWDGGQLVSTQAMDFIGQGGRMPLTPPAGDCSGGLNIAGDGASRCDTVFNYPQPGGLTVTGASRVASPGYVANDVVRINAADEPWKDLKGNLMDLVVRPDDSFDFRGSGMGYGTIRYHVTQVLTPRMKTGAMGARCMRLK